MYLGVDQSLQAPGFALVRTDGAVEAAVGLNVSQKGAARLWHIWERLAVFAGGRGVLAGALEGPSLKSVHREFDLGEISGVVRANALGALGLDLRVVAPAQLKKFATGNSAADKAAVLYHVKTRWGFATDDDNAADAVVLAQIARACHDPKGFAYRHRHEAEVVHALLHPKPKPARRRAPGRSTTNV